MSRILRGLLDVQAAEGWLPPARLEQLATELGVPLHRLESLSTFYPHFRRTKPEATAVSVCRDLSCRMAAGSSGLDALRALAEERTDLVLHEVSCLGRCDRAPAAAIGDAAIEPSEPESVIDRIARRDFVPAEREPRAWPDADPYRDEGLPPYSVMRAALDRGGSRVVEGLAEAGLRGMGGAGFPTAKKWSIVAAEEAASKHVICNADESEPGTFKDRELLHDLPHLVIEGILLAAYCVGASRGTVFIRREYAPERTRLEAAIAEARRLGALGKNVLGSEFSFELDVFVSPGGYILGEETALLECLEDRRGEPRNKPPFPGQTGLHGQPTVINNVETLVHSVGITHWGAAWWRERGVAGFAGHKFVSTSGDVERPGVELFPIGTKLSEILRTHGGMKGDATVLAIAPGGASSNFLGPEALDTPLDFDAISAAGSMLGSGAIVFVAEGRSLLDVGLSITRFFRNESCGKCVPCRVGSEKAVSILERAASVSAADQKTLHELDETMKQTSICGLGQVALGPVLSILDRFGDRVVGEADVQS